MVFGLVVRSRGLGGNLMAGLRSLGGGEIHEYTSLLEDTRRQALDRLVRNATLLGANAILSMRFDISELSGTMREIVAYGTAVVVAPDASAEAGRPRRSSDGRRPAPACSSSASASCCTIVGPGADRRRRRGAAGLALRCVIGHGVSSSRRAARAGPLPLGDAERTAGRAAGPGGGEPAGTSARAALPPRRDEVFVDPTTGVRMRVWLDPATGERRYVAED